MRVAIVHDYLTQRGGGERVVLSMLRAFPDAPVYTSFYEPGSTLSGFDAVKVRPLPINRIGPLRQRHRLALPLLAHSFGALTVEADVVICSSAGWSHGIQTQGRKVVYCHSPARWLYHQADRYLGQGRLLVRAALASLQPSLRRWDRRAALTAHRYLVNSTAIRDSVRHIYGIDAEVLPPPHSIDVNGPKLPVDLIEPGYILCV
ncbi:MAG: glycosyltransferase, partial [Candidatus Dormibacteria bacterium]